MHLSTTYKKQRAFTLFEVSIMLVIIGLLSGSVVVGQHVIRAAEVSSTISQVSKYKSAVNNFVDKYDALPGDLNSATATMYSFSARGSYAGEGDGNGVIQGVTANSSGANSGFAQGTGETTMFWEDLTYANGHNINLIEGTFKTASSTAVPGTISITNLPLWLPQAKLGHGNYFYVWSYNHINYFGLSAVNNITGNYLYSSTNMTVQQAYDIDKKIDDGLPQSGDVLAMYVSGATVVGAAGINSTGGSGGTYGAPGVSATQSSAFTCYDNGNVANTPQHYSLSYNGGKGLNCALSFMFP